MKNDATNLEQIAQVIKEKFTSTTNSFNSGLWKFVGTQGNMIDLKDFIDKINKLDDPTTIPQNPMLDDFNAPNIDRRLKNIDEHIIELGELFKEMRFEPVTKNTHSNILYRPNPIKDNVVEGKYIDKSGIFKKLYESTVDETKKTTSSWVENGVRNLESPLLEGAIKKIYGVTKAFITSRKNKDEEELIDTNISVKHKKESTENNTSSQTDNSKTESSFNYSSVKEQLDSVMSKTEDNEDDNRQIKQLNTIEKIEHDTTQYHLESSKLLGKIEYNTRLNNTLQKGGLIDDGLDILDRFKRKRRPDDINGSNHLEKIKGIGSKAVGGIGAIAGSLSLPLLAAGASALTFGGTGLISAYNAMNGNDSSNWISNSVDSVIQKISGDKNTSLGSTIYDIFNKSEQSKNEVMNNMVMKPVKNDVTSDSMNYNMSNSTMNITPDKTINITPVPDKSIDELENSLKVYERQSKEQPVIINNNTNQTQSNTPMPERGQDVIPVITRHQYNPLTNISGEMLKTSL